MLDGLSILNLVTGKIQFSLEAECVDLSLKCSSLQELTIFRKMPSYEKRLQELVCESNGKSTLLSFKSFVQHGASPRESVVLENSKRMIENFMTSLSGDISESRDAW